jgi:hypothetical protein
MKKEDYTLPRSVYLMCVHGALLVGSQAKRIMGEDIESHDYDLLVPLDKWQIMALMIPQDAAPNKFGGWRFKDDKGNEIDVWPDTLQNYLANGKSKYGEDIYAIDYSKNKVYSSKTIKL